MNFSKAIKAAVIIFTGAIAAAGLTACGGIKTEADSPSKGGVKIGFIAALTGGAAAYGKSQEEGIRMAVEEINQKGAIPIELFVEDSKGSPSDAMNVTKRLIQKKAAVIIGPMTSNEAKAAGPIMQNAKISDYEGVETISIVTKNIDKVEEFFQKLLELKLQSSNIQVNEPEFFITNIERYKKDMVVDASRNAEIRAIEMLKVNNNEIGGLKNISQGQFEILEDTEDVRKINENEANQIYKKMRVVVTATYLIKY